MLRIDFDTSVGGSRDLILFLGSHIGVMAEARIEQQRPDAGGADIEAYNVVVERRVTGERCGVHFSI